MNSKFNNMNLPDKYEYIFNHDTGKVGLVYKGAKETETVLPAIYETAEAFKSLGKILIVFRETENSFYTLTNKSGKIKIVNILDILASSTALYLKMPGKFKGNPHEWNKISTDMRVEKNIGCMEISDTSLRNGERILPTHKSTVDMVDKHNKNCRLTLRNGDVDEVLTFASSAKVKTVTGNAKSNQESDWHRFEFDLTTGQVSMFNQYGELTRINKFKSIAEYAFAISPIVNSKLSTSEEMDSSGRVHKLVSTERINASNSEKVAKFIRSFAENTDFALIAMLACTYPNITNNDAYKKSYAHITGSEYSICVVSVDKMIVIAIKKHHGKIVLSSVLRDESLWCLGNVDTHISVDKISKKQLDDKSVDFSQIGMPINVANRRSYNGIVIGAYKYTEFVSLELGLKLVSKENPEAVANMKFSLGIFGNFEYYSNRYMAREIKRDNMSLAVGCEGLTRQEEVSRYNKKYDPKNTLISTKTNWHSSILVKV